MSFKGEKEAGAESNMEQMDLEHSRDHFAAEIEQFKIQIKNILQQRLRFIL